MTRCLSLTQAEVGAPGIVVGVSVDGVQIWCEGLCLCYKATGAPITIFEAISLICIILKNITY